MARIVKAPTARRNEILDVAQRLIYTKGYEQMTIQDILDSLQISKGAFYHYFDSKQALLEAMIERMLQEVEQILLPILNDRELPALEKLHRFFATANHWKTARKDFFLALLQVWYRDDNAIVRQKLRATGATWLAPWLSTIIRQGVQEGILTTSYPDRVGEVILALVMELGETLGRLLLSFKPEHDDLLRIEDTVAVYTDALERVLGTPKGSLQIIDSETLKAWFVS
jgi:TetR/AcrR family transcriptional repressor of nem operon